MSTNLYAKKSVHNQMQVKAGEAGWMMEKRVSDFVTTNEKRKAAKR